MTQAKAQDILCRLSDIPDGGSLGLAPNPRGRDQILLVRKGSRVFGYVNNCPHYDRAPMGWRKDEFLNGDRSLIMCASHGALFRIEDGVCVLGPCIGQALQPVPLRVLEGKVLRDFTAKQAGTT